MHSSFSAHPGEPCLCCLLKVACGTLARSPSQLLMQLLLSAANRQYAIQIVMGCASSSKQALLLGMLTHQECVRNDQALCCAGDVELGIIKQALVLGTLSHKKCVTNDQALCCAGDVELGIIKQALVLGMRCTSTSMRNKWTGLLTKLLRRVLMSVHAALNRQRLAIPKTGRGPHVDVHAQKDLAGVLGFINSLQ